MVVGLDTFKAFFKDYSDTYLIIGGTACDFLIENEGFVPRATDDIDMVLIIEALTPAFFVEFWKFIKLGEYTINQIQEEKRNCYRFCEPENKTFPKQIELFSKIPDLIPHDGEFHLTPIPSIEGVSNLSAILLNEDYYNYTIEHSFIKDDVHYANIEAIICLKAYAYLDNKKRKLEGQEVKQRDIDKHKYDIFRMVFLVSPETRFEVPVIITNNLQAFVDEIADELPPQDTFKQNNYGKPDVQKLFMQLKTLFNLK